jgi:hypothetical protein
LDIVGQPYSSDFTTDFFHFNLTVVVGKEYGGGIDRLWDGKR